MSENIECPYCKTTPMPVYVRNITELLIAGFLTNNSGGEDGYCVKIQFANVQDAQAFHRSLVEIREGRRIVRY